MPYIKPENRKLYDFAIKEVAAALTTYEYSPGDFNYVITKICLAFISAQDNCEVYNEVIGVLECAKLEFYRRRVAAYEDGKIEQNGDVDWDWADTDKAMSQRAQEVFGRPD